MRRGKDDIGSRQYGIQRSRVFRQRSFKTEQTLTEHLPWSAPVLDAKEGTGTQRQTLVSRDRHVARRQTRTHSFARQAKRVGEKVAMEIGEKGH